MNSEYAKNSQQNSVVDTLRQKNERALSELEIIPYQPQVYAIPIAQREQEQKLLKEAAQFQPLLYQLISQLATREEMASYIAKLEEVELRYLEYSLIRIAEENQQTNEEMRTMLKQAGNQQEEFISDCSDKLSRNIERLEFVISSMKKKIMKIMLGTALSSVMLSVIVCVLLPKLIG